MDGSDSGAFPTCLILQINEGGRYSREWRPPCFSASPPKPLSEGEGSEMMVKQSIYTASPPKPLSKGEGSEMMVKQSFEHIEESARSASAAVSAVSNTRKTFYSPLLRRGG